MHLPLTLAFNITDKGIVIDIIGEGASETVTIDPRDLLNGERIQQIVLSTPEIKPGRVPPNKRIKRRSTREETLIAEQVGGKKQKASGALPWAKGDIRKKGHLRIESKVCKVKQYTITRLELNKIRGECAMNEKPAFVITFINPSTLRQEDKWVLIPFEDWHEAHIDR